jgi:folate-binding protein YgfZ
MQSRFIIEVYRLPVDNPQQTVATLELTPLAESLHATTAEPYCGALTVPSFDEARLETLASLKSCGMFDLGYNSRIRVRGDDKVRWLNGMVTNSAQSLEAGTRNYNFVLNAQGRIQGDLFAYRRAEDFILETTREQRDALLAWFDRYIIMDDVELTSLDADLTAIGIAGPSASSILEKIGISATNLGAGAFISTRWNTAQITVCRADNMLVPRYEIWIHPAEIASLWSTLAEAGAVPCGTRAEETLRILSGTPRYGVDIRGRDLPQETNQTRALHFAKGCYLGQEIVERIRSRGAVHRSFEGFVLTGRSPAPGASLNVDGKPVGELTSVTETPDGSQIALGYARRELVERGATFQYDGGTASATALPFQLSLE